MKEVYGIIRYQPRIVGQQLEEEDPVIQSPFFFEREFEAVEYKKKNKIEGKVIKLSVVEDWDTDLGNGT